jgi:hypothetical protein
MEEVSRRPEADVLTVPHSTGPHAYPTIILRVRGYLRLLALCALSVGTLGSEENWYDTYVNAFNRWQNMVYERQLKVEGNQTVDAKEYLEWQKVKSAGRKFEKMVDQYYRGGR